MWWYLGTSCSDRLFSAELVDVEVDTWVRRILALRVIRRSGSSPVPLRDEVASPWVCPLGLVST
jgi:hypothetical protein